jgi:uncharacterized integral membrane protein
MRWFHVTVVVVFVVATLLFAVQNFASVTISFLGSSVHMPLALLVVVVYLLGMLTGSSVVALLRRSLQASRQVAER